LHIDLWFLVGDPEFHTRCDCRALCPCSIKWCCRLLDVWFSFNGHCECSFKSIWQGRYTLVKTHWR